MENENKIFNTIPETITIPEIKVIVSGETESKVDFSELPPPPPQISIFD